MGRILLILVRRVVADSEREFSVTAGRFLVWMTASAGIVYGECISRPERLATTGLLVTKRETGTGETSHQTLLLVVDVTLNETDGPTP